MTVEVNYPLKLDVSERTISSYLPQKYKNSVQSSKAQNSAKPSLAKNVEKAVKVLAETVKAVEKSPCAEEKRAETAQNLKASQVLLEQVLLDTIITKTEQQSPTTYMLH